MHQSVVPPTPTLVNEREWAGSAGSIPRRSVRGVLRRAFLSLWRVGWEPLDVAHVGARQLPKELRSLLPVALELDLVAQRSRLSDRFVSQADALGFDLEGPAQLDGQNKCSFLRSFAQRIRERLSEGTRAARVDAEATFGGALVPVMASRAEAVDGLRSTLFPVTINRETSITNASGYHAGRRAADQAILGVGGHLTTSK